MHGTGATVDGNKEVALASLAVSGLQLGKMLDIDVNKTEIIILEDTLASGRLRGDWRSSPTEAFASKNSPDAVAVKMRQEVRHHEGQVVEGKVRALPQGADHSPLFVRGLPRKVMGAGRAVLARVGSSLAPFADSLGADPIAHCERTTWFRRSSDFRAGHRCRAGIRMDLEHGSPPSRNSALKGLESVAIYDNSTADRVPTMFRNLTARRRRP